MYLHYQEVRVAYVGNFLNYGSSLSTVGTAIVYMLAEFEEIEEIDVYCNSLISTREQGYIPDKVNIFPIYDSRRPLSTLNLYSINWKKYDSVIFNILPTVFGKSSMINVIGLMAPIVLSKMGNENIKVIYHNSTMTNDIEQLGYNSSRDKVRSLVLSMIEKLMFKTVSTFFPVNLYVNLVRTKVRGARVGYINLRYFEGLTTIFINSKNYAESIKRPPRASDEKMLLLHGYWGPQKNIELALSSLMKIREKGIAFHLTLSGSVNSNFQAYENEFNDIIKRYSSIIDERIDYVSERDIMLLFLKSDLVIIPYNTPGGHSGVLETAITFENNVLCISHPEYIEQSSGFNRITFCNTKDFIQKLQECLELPQEMEQISISKKIESAHKNLKEIL